MEQLATRYEEDKEVEDINLKTLSEIKREYDHCDYHISIGGANWSSIEYLRGDSAEYFVRGPDSFDAGCYPVVYRYIDTIRGSEPKFVLVSKDDIIHELMEVNADEIIKKIVEGVGE